MVTFVDQVQLVSQREGQAPALATAAEPSAPEPTQAAATSGTLGWRRGTFRGCWRDLRLPFPLTGKSLPERGDRGLGGRPGLQRLREVEAPTYGVAARLLKIHRRQIDCNQIALRIAHEPIGKGRLQRFAGGGEAGLRIVDPLADIFGPEAQVGLFERLPIAADLEHVAPVGAKVGIAAGQGRHLHGLAGREVEDADIGRFNQRVAELLERGRAILTGPAGGEVEPRRGSPVEAGAERRQRAEVAERGHQPHWRWQ